MPAFEALENRRLFALAVTPFNPANPASTLVDTLLLEGTGINVTGSSYTGANGQGGTFTGFRFTSTDLSLNIEPGVLLTSGSADAAEGNVNRPDNVFTDETTSLATPGDSDLDALVGETTNDANALTIQFTATSATRSVLIDFIFGSEEFPDFVGSFNDAFAAYLDGVQISFDTNAAPITVNNNFFLLNNSGVTSAQEPAAAGKTPVDFNEVEYDGLTPRIRTTAPLNSSITTHTLKLVIADTADDLLDSGVFLAGLQGSTRIVSGPTTDLPNAGTFAFDSGSYTVVENAGSRTITVNRLGGTDGLATVDFTTSAGSATAGADFTTTSGTLTFADGEATKTFVIPILDDGLSEGDEDFAIALSNATGGAELSSSNINSTVEILDNESSIEFGSATFTSGESGGVANVTLVRAGALSVPATVEFTTSDGTALAGVDYRPASTTVNFAPGQTEATVQVPVKWDFEDGEGTETINLALSNPSGGVELGTQSTATLNLTNTVHPPTVSGVQFLTSGNRTTGVVLSYNEGMDEATVEDVENYGLFQLKERRNGGAPARKAVRITSADYDPAAQTVTLNAAKPLKNNVFYEVVVDTASPSGVRTGVGDPIDGNFDGTEGDNFVQYIARGNKISYFDKQGDKVKLSVGRGRVIELIRDVLRDAREVRVLGDPGGTLTGTFDRSRSRTSPTDGRITIDTLVGADLIDLNLERNRFEVVYTPPTVA